MTFQKLTMLKSKSIKILFYAINQKKDIKQKLIDS